MPGFVVTIVIKKNISRTIASPKKAPNKPKHAMLSHHTPLRSVYGHSGKSTNANTMTKAPMLYSFCFH